jgi:hypothetical protein
MPQELTAGGLYADRILKVYGVGVRLAASWPVPGLAGIPAGPGKAFMPKSAGGLSLSLLSRYGWVQARERGLDG